MENKKLDGKTVIITGANCGIGYETALDLAKRNARVILACRDEKKAQEATEKIKQESKNDLVEYELLNLSSLTSVREFSERMKQKLEKLDILINNAGIAGVTDRQVTEDGFESILGVNYLSHFYLTNLLLDLLKKSAPSRIINVSSAAYSMAKINFEDLQSEKKYQNFDAYGQSKLAMVLFTVDLARRLKGTGVTTVSLHPGMAKTEIFRDIQNQKGFLVSSFRLFVKLFAKTAKECAKTSIHCAIDDNIPKQSGSYFEACQVKEISNYAKNLEIAEKLWDISSILVGLDIE